MNTSWEKLGRILWVSYLILALPVVFFCLWIDVLHIREWFRSDAGPIELPPQGTALKTVSAISTTLIPIMWISLITFGHRFNGRWRAIIPFLGNLVPLSCLTVITYSVMRFEHNGWDWEFLYLAGLVVVLTFGVVCVVVVARNK